MNVTENNCCLDGQRDFLSQLVKASGEVSEMKGGVLITNPINGYLEVVSFGYHPLDLAEELANISETIKRTL